MDEIRYVALGDSFTEGVGDDRPDGTQRGWADLVSEGLAASGARVLYANLAIRGRLLGPIIDEQVGTGARARTHPRDLQRRR